MPLPSSGQITLDQMHVEAGGSTTTQGAVNDADIRSLIGAASGGPNLAFTDWYGASAYVTINITISSNTNNYNLWNSKGGTYSAGKTTVNVTINSGVTIGSTSSATYAFTTGLGWATGDVINITNNGTIKGRGGNGGAGGNAVYGVYSGSDGSNGVTGGPAFRGQFVCTVTNNGSVYGGGGGGGGGGGSWSAGFKGDVATGYTRAAGGGGGGAGVTSSSGGAGGSASNAQGNNSPGLAGSGGTATAGGAGGLNSVGGTTNRGGAGGGLGADGATGIPGVTLDAPSYNGTQGSGGTRGYYQVGSSLINLGSGIGGTVGGRSA